MAHCVQTGSSELVKKQEVKLQRVETSRQFRTLSQRLWENAQEGKQDSSSMLEKQYSGRGWLGGQVGWLRAKACPEVMEVMGQKIMVASKMTTLGLNSTGAGFHIMETFKICVLPPCPFTFFPPIKTQPLPQPKGLGLEQRVFYTL